MASSRFTAQQRQAVVQAILEHELTAEQAARAAASGTLPGTEQLEAFPVSASSARGWAGEERRRLRQVHLGDSDVLEAARGQVARLSTLIETALQEEESKPPGELNVDRIRQLGKAAVSVAQAARSVNRRVPARGEAPARTGDADDADDFLAALAAKG